MAWVTVNHTAAPVVNLKAEGNTGSNQENVEKKHTPVFVMNILIIFISQRFERVSVVSFCTCNDVYITM